jgi:hypothetical protein
VGVVGVGWVKCGLGNLCAVSSVPVSGVHLSTAYAHVCPNGYGVRVEVNLLMPFDNEASIGGISRVTKEIRSGTEELF